MVFFEVRPEEQEFLKSALSDHELYFSPDPVNAENLPNTELEVVSTHTDSKIDAELINKLPNLKLIATRTTGFDHIDLKTAASKNIPVCNVPSYGENTVAEYAFGLLLTVSRKLYQGVYQVKQQGDFSTTKLQGFDLQDKTIGVLGTGKIGQRLIKMALGFNMKVIAYDAFPNQKLKESLNFEYVDFETLLKNSDIISIHTPYLPTTHHLINLQNIQQIKKGCVLINTARGPIAENAALLEGLESGIFSGLGIDVYEAEKEMKTGEATPESEIVNKLKGMDNCIITPHNAFNSKEAQQRISQTTVDNIHSFINGTPQNLVPAA